MKEQRQARGIYALLITCMLLLGMCFEGLEADSSFLYALGQEEIPEASVICKAGDISLSQQAYLKETGAGREAQALIRQNTGKVFHRALREGRSGVLPASRPELCFFGRIFSFVDIDAAGTSHSSMVILEYIHQKDGKKA